jgi:hypothetical protein
MARAIELSAEDCERKIAEYGAYLQRTVTYTWPSNKPQYAYELIDGTVIWNIGKRTFNRLCEQYGYRDQ